MSISLTAIWLTGTGKPNPKTLEKVGFLQWPVYKPHHNTHGKHWKKPKPKTLKQSQWVSCRDLSINLTVIWLAATGKPHSKHSEKNQWVACTDLSINLTTIHLASTEKQQQPQNTENVSVGFLQGHVYKPPCSTISRHWKTQTQNTEKVSQWVSCRDLSINLTVIRLAGTGKPHTKHPEKYQWVACRNWSIDCAEVQLAGTGKPKQIQPDQ